MTRWPLVYAVCAVCTFCSLGACSAPPRDAEASTAQARDAEASSAQVRDAGREMRCRCPEQPLQTYYSQAEEVVIGRLATSRVQGSDYLLDVVVTERPWKIPAGRGTSVRIGDTLHYVTSTSSAECGLDVRGGAEYVLFAPALQSVDAAPRVDGCGGTRVLRSADHVDPQGFVDVPGRFVVSQLNALSGLEFLERVVRDAPGRAEDNTSLVGLLDVPAFAHGGFVTLRSEPRDSAPIVATPASYRELDAREVSYETPAAVVVAKTARWFRVRLASGSYGWISPGESGTWFPYDSLPIGRLAYLTSAWSGHVWPDAGAGIPARSARKGATEREEYPANVLESALIGGTLWFRVQVLSGDPCEGGEVRPELSGWVPGSGVAGIPVVW